MKRLLLAKTQRNQVLEVLEAHGLAPAEFDWREAVRERIPTFVDEAYVSELVHRPSGYRFRFEPREDAWGVEFTPGTHTPEENQFPGPWAHALNYVGLWAVRLKQEIESPDLWAPFRRERALLTNPASTVADTPFTPTEKQKLIRVLDEMKQQFLEHLGDQEELRTYVTERFDYLKEAADRSRRPDWLNILVGTMVGLFVNAAIPSEKARQLLQHACEALSSILDFPQLLP